MRNCNLFISLVELRSSNLLIAFSLRRRFSSNDQMIGNNQKGNNQDEINYNEIPEAPNPDTCCRSGCANCVYLDYATKLEEHFKDGGIKAQQEIDQLIDDPIIKQFIKMQLVNKSNPEDPPSS